MREGSGADTDERPKEPLIARSRSRSYSLGSIFIQLTRLDRLVLFFLHSLHARCCCKLPTAASGRFFVDHLVPAAAVSSHNGGENAEESASSSLKPHVSQESPERFADDRQGLRLLFPLERRGERAPRSSSSEGMQFVRTTKSEEQVALLFTRRDHAVFESSWYH